MQCVPVTRKRRDCGRSEKLLSGKRTERGLKVGKRGVRRVMRVAYKRLRESETQRMWTVRVIQDGRVKRNNQLWRRKKKQTKKNFP